MPDNSWQSHTLNGPYGALLARYERYPNTFVAINLLLCYREDGIRYLSVPDLFVVFGVSDKHRPSYKVWEEGKVPDFVLEVASEGTYENDLGSKKNTYERMGVREYCVFDPKGGMHRPRLQLFRLEDGVYKCVSGRSGPDGLLTATSETLGLEFRFVDGRMRLWDPEAREYLLDQREVRARYERERTGRLKERAGRLKERAGRLKERDGRLKERDGRLKERDGRIAAEQRASDIEAELADLKEQLLGKR